MEIDQVFSDDFASCLLAANGIVRGIEESSSDAELKENSSQKVILPQLY